jgi:hypothetical protein
VSSQSRILVAVAAVLAAVSPVRAERWKLQYFYDQDKSTLRIADMAFSSPRRGVAVGAIYEGKDERPTVLVTADGGDHWTTVSTKDAGTSIYLLNDQLGWMVTAKGIWRTTEGGRNWIKLPSSPKGALRVWFFDENHGYAVGTQKGVFETTDGGHKWVAVPDAAKPAAEPKYTAYGWVSFAGNSGEIIGWSKAPDRLSDAARPAWMDPSAAISRYDPSGILAVLQTKDGGKHWAAIGIKYRGWVTRVRHALGPLGLWLFEFSESAQVPSEVVRWNGEKNSLVKVFSSKERKISDIWITPSGTGYASGGEVLGQLRTLPIPGKLKVLRATGPDYVDWKDMDVDYRAEASRTVMAGSGERDLWIATDTGMILKLEP